MAHWLRFEHEGRPGFGTVDDGTIRVHTGDMFGSPVATGQALALADVKVLTPTVPSKMVALVDNYHALVTKLGHAVPAEPLYFLKGNS